MYRVRVKNQQSESVISIQADIAVKTANQGLGFVSEAAHDTHTANVFSFDGPQIASNLTLI